MTALALPSRASELSELLTNLAAVSPPAHRAVSDRLASFVVALGQEQASGAVRQLAERAGQLIRPDEPGHLWLLTSVLTGQLPAPPEVQRLSRLARLDGAPAALLDVLRGVLATCQHGPDVGWPAVEVVTGQTLVDVDHTARTTFATGIQRVALEVSSRWLRDRDVTLVGWSDDHTALRHLEPAELNKVRAATDPAVPVGGSDDQRERAVLVPWRCRYLLPELLAEPERALRLQALLRFSAVAGGVIGFDCVPLMSAETTAYGMAGGFTQNLAAISHLQRVAAISDAAAQEYRGWRRMLSGTGRTGPEIAAVSLPVVAAEVGPGSVARARDRIGLGGLPTVLVVGSHEPRKNHLAVLHAAELLWRQNLRFNLVFIGGNAWSSDRFAARVRALQAAGRPVLTVLAAEDDLLWSAYRLARCTVFPSLSEGFGLPVAESLACGTPVITSDFGSMREIAEPGGALLVNPRDDAAIAEALRRLLTDDDLHRELVEQARLRPHRSWDDYAAEVWQFLTGTDPAQPPLQGPRTGDRRAPVARARSGG